MRNNYPIILFYKKNNNQNQLQILGFHPTLNDSYHKSKLTKRQYKHKNLMKLNQILRHNLKKILIISKSYFRIT